MNKTELSINELPQQRTKLPISPNWAAEAGKGDEGGAACSMHETCLSNLADIGMADTELPHALFAKQNCEKTKTR